MKPIQGIYALCDTSLTPAKDHLSLAQDLLRGGAPILQLRMKGEENLKKVRDIAMAIRGLKKQYSFTFIVNDFIDIAVEVGADGIHLGQDDYSLREARAKVGPKFLIGYSSHSLEEARQAEDEEADYVALGAIYPTKSKGPGHPVAGIPLLKEVIGHLKVPVVAIGGIGRNNFSTVVETGASAVAMIGALTQAKDISEETKWFSEKFNRILNVTRK